MGFEDIPNYIDSNGNGKKVIMFYGDDCNACDEIKPSVELLVEKYHDVQFSKANYKGEVAQQFGVTTAPFFVVLEDEEIKGRVTGLHQKGIGGKDYVASPLRSLEKRFGKYLGEPTSIVNLENNSLEQKVKESYSIGNEDNLGFSDNAMRVLRERYLAKDADGKTVETVDDMFRRVSSNVASADSIHYGENEEDTQKTESKFYDLMVSKKFMPNSPTLMNAGRGEQQLAACFVLPIEDNMDSIAYTVGDTAMIHKSGGGTGFSFSRLRPKNSLVTTTYGKASGPVSFMDAYDRMTEAVNQGGFRRGANMAILRVDHPDIKEFIACKNELDLKNRDVYKNFKERLDSFDLDESELINSEKNTLLNNIKKSLVEKQLNNFNISVGVTDKFMEAVKGGLEYDLINPRGGKACGKQDANEMMNIIAEQAWKTGEPGVVFLDEINRHNPTPQIGEIESTNPCGEQPLLPYEACNLGSINLSKFIENKNINYEDLEKVVSSAVHFLDNVIDMSNYPLIRNEEPDRIEKLVKANRKIGLGVMGLTDTLIGLGIKYDSEEGIEKTKEIMSFIKTKAREASSKLADKRGVFPNWQGSIFDSDSEYFQGEDLKLRNATITTIAPTGSISMISDASGGIEPLYAVKAKKTVLDGQSFEYLHPELENKLKEKGIEPKEIVEKLNEKRLNEIDEVPEDIKNLFSTTHSISADAHVKMQATVQEYVDNAVSKTINFPNSATVDDIKKAYLLAHELKCKGLTVYRDGSRDNQIFTSGNGVKKGLSLEDITANDGKEVSRPDVTVGFVVKTPVGQDPLTREDRTMYNLIAMDDNARLIESFMNLGRSGGEMSTLAESLGRSVSEMLRDGKNPERLVEMYHGIRGDNPGYDGERIIHSVPDGVSQNVKRVINGEFLDLLKKTTKAYETRVKAKQESNGVERQKINGDGKPQDVKVEPVEGKKVLQEKQPCPKCGKTNYEIITMEGCIKFNCCSYSPKGCG